MMIKRRVAFGNTPFYELAGMAVDHPDAAFAKDALGYLCVTEWFSQNIPPVVCFVIYLR